MKKPELRWESARHRARLVEPQAGSTTGAATPGSRLECFSLEFDGSDHHDPHQGRAQFELQRQRVDARSLELDRVGVVRAVQAWLVARGGSAIALETFDGERVLDDDLQAWHLDTATLPGDARRIVSLAPSNLDVCEALGVLDRVVGCEDSSIPPAGAVKLGPDLAPDLDRVAQLRPDLVLASLTVPGMERVVMGLHARGIPHVVLAPRRLSHVKGDLVRSGRAIGVAAAGLAAEERFEAERRRLEADKPDGPPARVYLEWWPRPMFTPGEACFSNELIALAGGRNVFGEREGSSIEVSAEDLLATDPDVCFVSWCGVEAGKLDPQRLIAREGLEALRAGRSGAVHPLDERYAGRPGPQMLEASRRMAAVIRDLSVR